MFSETVVFACKFISKKGETFTRLYIPIGADVTDVFVKGDKTALAGKECAFRLYMWDGTLKIGLAEDEEE